MSKRASTSTQAGPSARKRVRVLRDQETSESEVAGKLLHISLKNFMCHGNFKLDFNERMNFILGHNGSGKSGILTAIIVGLGGTAKATNRSNTLSKLVKNGESNAVIEIHISNIGPDAFEPENYGDRIIVVRTILERGGGHYKILNENRDLISKAKNKLDLILRYFEITVNNPITILTQDCARTFLRDSDSKARFKLFKKGSGLETIEEEMATCVDLQNSIEVELQRRKEKSKYFRGEYKERMRIYEMLETAERARERTVKLEAELTWVAIQEEEKDLENLNKELEKRVKTLEKSSGEVEELNNKKNTLEQSIQLLTSEVSKVESGRATQSQEITAKKEAMQGKRNEFFSTRKRFLGIDGRVKQAKADISAIAGNIAEIAQQEERDGYEREVAELETQQAATEQQIAERTEKIGGAQNRIAEMEEKLYSLQSVKAGLSRTVAHCREQMAQIQNETDNLTVYGAHIPQFVKALERNQAKFSKMPLGPIGRYLEVADERYKSVIEQLVNSQLGTFIVNTPRDHEAFLQLFRKECPNKRCPQIIQRQFRDQPYDTSRFGVQVPRNATSPLQQLRCKNTVVMNTIIDMLRIEQVLICDNMAMGRKLTENLENVPRNLKRVIVMEPLCEVFPKPNFRIYSWTPTRCKFIQVSAEEKRSQLKEQFEEHHRKLEEAKGTFTYTENTALQMKQARKQMVAEVQALERTKRDLTTKIADIKDQFLGPRNEEETLLEEKQRLEEQLEHLTVEYAPLKAKMDELTQQLEDMNREIQQAEQTSTAFESKLDEARERVNELRDKLSRLQLMGADKASTLQALEQRVVGQRRETNEKRRQVDEMIAAGGERIRTRKTREEVREEISHLNAQRQVSTQITESREDIMAELAVLEDSIAKLTAEFELGMETLKVQENAVKKHQRDYEERKRVVKQRMSQRFRELLAQQSYNGDLTIDYEKATLDLEINPRQSGTVQGTKSLSGGERSFSTVAFLLSIWSCIEHPFFMLDEYDVFTDGSNRELMTRMLIQEAMAKPNNQYMFLTPQDVSHLIKPSAELEVFKMPDKS